MGDGRRLELGVVSTPFGVVGGLLCWENYMPLARAAIYAQHCDIYLAPTWDNSDTWVATLRHIAKEGRQFVIGVAPLLRGSDVPEDLPGRDLWGGDEDWSHAATRPSWPRAERCSPDRCSARRASSTPTSTPPRRAPSE